MQAICSRLVAGILALPVVCSAQAADLGSPPPAAAYVTPVQPLSIVSEVRIGGAVQDPGSAEKNTNAINGEILFSKPVVSLDPFWQAFVPRPTVGGSYNFDGRTSFAYIGATWTVDLFPQTLNNRVFLEGFFGAGAHNGYTGLKANAPAGFNALGCNPLFREAAALGYRLTEHWSIMATVEHMSNAGLCHENRGLTNFGGKIGYTF
ncbi:MULTISPECIES: acyloxyacyl hydrolase [unclassified Methylobacterium]|jgi:lipid A 3-O-deacylase|uniref:acyloxyacyl hydrolase n=1 Tax=unclassified Methylobacterium TaxID=2615210 RepID=UPI0006F64FDB|nr:MULTISPECIES: acyloxyacyl hydrolase [unclassified Methylobacterium]KQO45674.1 lipid A 3-O-deacylase [Methylobacterium sp. Leaf86]KQO97979.1 lipid A 3-O-deacylase [Methylobacterium sp. Leaf91]